MCYFVERTGVWGGLPFLPDVMSLSQSGALKLPSPARTKAVINDASAGE